MFGTMTCHTIVNIGVSVEQVNRYSIIEIIVTSGRMTSLRHVVVVLNDDNPMHVPMSLRARTSALDVWLAVIKKGLKSV